MPIDVLGRIFRRVVVHIFSDTLSSDDTFPQILHVDLFWLPAPFHA